MQLKLTVIVPPVPLVNTVNIIFHCIAILGLKVTGVWLSSIHPAGKLIEDILQPAGISTTWYPKEVNGV
jgi:hypothetical protein